MLAYLPSVAGHLKSGCLLCMCVVLYHRTAWYADLVLLVGRCYARITRGRGTGNGSICVAESFCTFL